MARNIKGLKNREYGYQFSDIEYSLIFKKDNIGFVQFDRRNKNYFYLAPSPFLDPIKSEIYVLEGCPPPKEHELIEAAILNSDTKILENRGIFSKIKIKYVHSWKKVNPNSLIKRKRFDQSEYIEKMGLVERNRFEQSEFKNFFELPFNGDSEYIEKMGYCFSLYAISSPQMLENVKGGLNAAILGKNKQWNAFKRIMDVIPSEFKKISSRNFYKLLDKEAMINPIHSAEVNLAYYNPPTMPVQIPVALDIDTKLVSSYKEDIDYLSPMVRAYILDTLLLEPKIPKKLNSVVTDRVYELIDDVKKSGNIPYNQDLGLVIPKLSSSFARLNHHDTTTKEDITKGVDLWSDMFYHAKKAISTQLDISKLYSLSSNAKKLYIDLDQTFGVDTLIDKANALKNSKLSEWDFEEAFNELSNKGAIYYPDTQHFMLLYFRSSKS